MNPELQRYLLDQGLVNEYLQYAQPHLLSFVNQQQRRRPFTRGGYEPKRSVEDIMSRGESGTLRVYHGIPDDLYSSLRGAGAGQSGAFHQGDNIYIRKAAHQSLGHELGHELYGHSPEHGSSVPELSRYQQLDLKMGGWLPSASKYGIRPPSIFPNVKGSRMSREDYNERIVDKGYNPEFADAPFNILHRAITQDLPKDLIDRINAQRTAPLSTKAAQPAKETLGRHLEGDWDNLKLKPSPNKYTKQYWEQKWLQGDFD